MKTNIVAIGNSQGVRLSKTVMKECGFGRQVELRVSDGKVEISPIGRKRPRDGWEEAFRKAKADGDNDDLILADVTRQGKL